MPSNRNSLIYLLEIYELLIDKPCTFHSIRKKIGIGYSPLKKLLETFEADGLIHLNNVDNKVYYEGTKKMYELFAGSFYLGIRHFRSK